SNNWVFTQLVEINSDYYGLNYGGEIWRIDTTYLPNSSFIINLRDFFPKERYWMHGSLSKVQTTCDSFRLITTMSADPNSAVTYFYELSWPDFDTTRICVNEDQRVKWLLAIDDQPPYDNCDLVVDLDEDNSTGLSPVDYRSRYECSSRQIPIVDSDVYLYTRSGYDSLVLQLGGIKNPGEEYLSGPSSLDFVIEGNQTDRMVIRNTASLRIGLLSEYLSQVVYSNTSVVPVGGVRTVEFYLYEEGYQAPTATAYIDLEPHMERAGPGDTLYLCEGDSEIDLYDRLHSSASPAGHWLDPLGQAFDGRISGDSYYGGSYAYVVDRLPCIPDTAWFEVAIAGLPRFTLGSD